MFSRVAYVSVFVLCLFFLCKVTLGEEGLYKETDPLRILDTDNFNQTVLSSHDVWIVEFYSSWCGHCIHYAPTWKDFASNMTGWWPIVQVGAVNCADTLNRPLCRHQKITGVPSVKMFKPNSRWEDEPENLGQKMEQILTSILDLLADREKFHKPKHWPNFTPLISMEQIWEDTKDDHAYVAFVFEKPDSYLGRQVILDTYRYKPLLVRTMEADSVAKYGINEFPSLYLINRSGTFTRLAKENNTRVEMVSALKNLLSSQELEAGDRYIKQRISGRGDGVPDMKLNEAAEPEVTVVKEGAYMIDIESTLHYSFRQEIAISPKIEGPKLAALKLFVAVVAKYLPLREEVQSYVEKLSHWLHDMDIELSGEQWLLTIDKLQTLESYLPEKVEWVGCAGSKPRYRGYPCGMWTLFHTLTVGAYQHNRANPKDLPIDVLSAIEGYMSYFFGCRVCVEHFLKMADKIQAADRSPMRAVIWLWQAHNQANRRLHGDESEDPLHPKIQFPSSQLCPSCHVGGILPENKTFEFLVKFYGKSDVIQVNTEEEDSKSMQTDDSKNSNVKLLDWWELQQRRSDLEKVWSLRNSKQERQKKKHQAKHEALKSKGGVNLNDVGALELSFEGTKRTSWSFSNIDLSLCMMFYLICTGIIVFLYYHFIVRRKYRPCGVFPKYSKL